MPDAPTLPNARTIEELRFRCRSLTHWWDFYQPTEWDPGYGRMRSARYVLHFRCTNCRTVRHDGYDRERQLVARRYDYDDDYKLDKGEEKPTAVQLRAWMLKRSKAMARSAA
jgi:hypothetical protein